MFGIDLNTDTVEFFDDAAYGKRSEISQLYVLLMAQPFSEVRDKGVAIDVFDGSIGFMSLVVFTSAGCFSEEDPVSGAVTGSFKAFCIDKGFQPVNGVMIESLPIRREGFSACG